MIRSNLCFVVFSCKYTDTELHALLRMRSLCMTISNIIITVVLYATALHCVASSESNKEAVRLVHELKLKENLHMIRMYRNGDPGLLGHRVFGITSIEVCGF